MSNARPTDVVIVSAVRTPIATAYKGSLVGVDALALAQTVITAAVDRSGIAPGDIEDMGFGESMQGGGNIGRHAAILAGLDDLPGVAIQRWCASGMAGMQWIAANIAAGMIDVGLAGGVESMSTAPAGSKPDADGFPAALAPARQSRHGGRATLQHGADRRRQHGQARWRHPGRGRPVGVRVPPSSRSGHRRGAIRERDRAGRPCRWRRVHGRRAPSPHSTLEKLASLPLLNPDFEGAVTTAGNASGLNDAAAALVLCSRAYAEANGLAPLGVIRGWSSVGDDPVRGGHHPGHGNPPRRRQGRHLGGRSRERRDQRGLRLGQRRLDQAARASITRSST